MKLILKIVIIVVTLVLASGLLHFYFMEHAKVNRENRHEIYMEETKRLKIATFKIQVPGLKEAVEIRAVVNLKEKSFRVSAAIEDFFPDLKSMQLAENEIVWVPQRRRPSLEEIPGYFAGLFIAFDGDYGIVLHEFRAYRVYRKYAEKFEIDYIFSNEAIPRDELAGKMRGIDQQVFEILLKNGVLTK